MSLIITDKLYHAAAEAELHLHSVHDTKVKKLSQYIRSMDTLARATGVEELVSSTVRHLKAIRFALASTPLPGNHRNLNLLGAIREVSQSAGRWKSIIADPAISLALTEVIPILEDLATQEENPLAAKLRELLPAAVVADAAYLLKETRYDSLVVRWLETACGIHEPVVVGPSALRGPEYYDVLFVFGCPRWFRNDGAGFVFDAPRAPQVHILALSWGGLDLGDSRVLPALRGQGHEFGKSKRRITVYGERDSIDHDLAADLSTTALFDIQSYLSRHRGYGGGSGDEIEYEARLFQLAANQAVLLDWDEQARSFCVDISAQGDDEDEQDDKLVCRRYNRDLEAGDFIILRTTGGGDLIPILADHIMGAKAKQPRDLERLWKTELQALHIEKGERELVKLLTDAGAIRANYANVKNWIRERTIRPAADSDFRAILGVCGLKGRESEFMKAATLILKAHKSAGFRIREMLIAEVRKVDLKELRRHGSLVFHLPELKDYASITAYRIERIQPETVMAQNHELGRPFELEDELWQL